MIQNTGYRILDTRMQDTGYYRIYDTEYRIQDTGYWTQECRT